MPLLLLALRRLALSLPTLALILVGLFLLLQLAPGDTVDAMLAQMGGGDPALAERLRAFYGLDATVAGAARPLPAGGWCGSTSGRAPSTASRCWT